MPNLGKVTAGIPGLLPEVRAQLDHAGVRRDYQRGLLADVEGRRKAAFKPDGSRPTHIREAQQGIQLEGWRIAARLHKLNPSLYFERSLADPKVLGIYHPDPRVGRQFICGMEVEMNPEFETRILDEAGECINTLRGWRSVLAKLIRGRFIGKEAAHKLFGPPSRDSENWAVLTC